MTTTRNIVISICLLVVIPILVFCYVSGALTIFQKNWPVIFITFFIMALGAALLINLNRTLLRLNQHVVKIANGDFTNNAAPDKAGDVSGMAISISQVTRKLREGADELERRAILIERYNQELKRISEVKSKYFSDLTHELRAPLINIDKSSGILLEIKNSIADEEMEKWLKGINNNAGRLLRLINNLLEASKIEAGQLSIQQELFDIRIVVAEAVNSLDKWRESKKLKLEVIVADNVHQVYADKERLAQVIINLLSNAIKYTPSGGAIRLKADNSIRPVEQPPGQEEQCVVISVHDTGVGIPPEQLNAIFERYKTVEVEDKALKVLPSTGLGLSIAKEIVQMHGGRMWAESKPGKGSTFTFILPVACQNNNTDTQKRNQSARKRILIIDDEETIRELLSRELQKRGHSVTVAGDGFEGLRKSLDSPYDIVITDIRLPRINGTDCIQILKRIRPESVCMVITGFPIEQNLKDILEKNSYPCIKKPFDLPEVLTIIEGLRPASA